MSEEREGPPEGATLLGRAGPAGRRSIRVFVSSTFRDMQRERDQLVKRIFPQLRKRCTQRGVTWSEVDLRWGIPDENEGEVLSVCLAEIERCRPFFIGLLGERYGWIPERLEAGVVEGRPWLRGHSGRSVTELEIVGGVLNDPTIASHAFFYFRDPTYIETRPAAERIELQEHPSEEEIRRFGRESAECRAEERRRKLEELKKRIRASGVHVREDYSDPEALGELVLADLTRVIDTLYPAGFEPDHFQREAAGHEAYAVSRTSSYIGRSEYLERLDAHAAGSGPPLVILGESGAGKSALLANWGIRFRREHPDEFVLMHFIGSSPHSSDWARMVERIMGELGEFHGIEPEPAGRSDATPDVLRLAFARHLEMAAARGRAVIIIGGLNQLQDRDGAPDLAWLPPVVPSNIRLVLSTLPGRPLDDIRRREWPTLGVGPLNESERKALISLYLRQYAKGLSPERIERIVDQPQTASPLYVRALLDELRLWGVHEELDERIDHYLRAGTVGQLYQRILARWEEDYEKERSGLVGEAMSLIWAAKRGLSEGELLELLGSGDSPLPSAHWSPFFLAAEQALANRSGLIGFLHEHLRRAVERRYLEREPNRTSVHLRLANYFDSRRADSRSVDELPWQLAEAEAWPRLQDLLADLDFFRRAWPGSEMEVKEYWARVEDHSSIRLADAYRDPISASDPDPEWAFGLSKLLLDTAHVEEARTLLQRLVERCRARRDRVSLQRALVNLAVALQRQEALERAEALLQEAAGISREQDDDAGLTTCLANRAAILLIREELQKAVELLSEQEQVCRRIEDQAGLALTLGNRAVANRRMGRLDDALTLHREEEEIYRRQGDIAGLNRSLDNQATILQSRGEWDAALSRYRESERICRRLGNLTELQISLGNQATILVDRGDLTGGMDLFVEQERICRQIGDLRGLQRAIGNQGAVLVRRGQPHEAMRHFREKEKICRELDDRGGLHLALGNQGQVLRSMGRLDEALELLAEQERICRQIEDMEGLQDALGNQGAAFLDRDELDQAMALFEEQEGICRKLGHRLGVAIALGNQALVHRRRREPGRAMSLLDESERVFRALGQSLELTKILVNRAMLVGEAGHVEEALALLRESYEIATEHGFEGEARKIKAFLERIVQAIQNLRC